MPTLQANEYVGLGIPPIQGDLYDTDGILRASIIIKRLSDNAYWNGSSWQAGSVAPSLTLNRHGSSVSASYFYDGPNSANLSEGTNYTIIVEGIDNIGNRSIQSKTIGIDKTGPSITSTSPADNATVTSLASISASTSDPAGLYFGTIYIKRAFDSKFWDAYNKVWTTNFTSFYLNGPSSTQAPPTSFTFTNNMGLTSTYLTAGAYYWVYLDIYDARGNKTSKRLTIRADSNL
jgi:hypothetical protein